MNLIIVAHCLYRSVKLSNYDYRNIQFWYKGTTIGITILVQVFCSVCILCAKVNILIKEKISHDGNTSASLCLEKNLKSEAPKGIEKSNVRNLTTTNRMEMKKRGNKVSTHTNAENTSDRITLPRYLKNNLAHNKILTEVYHILIIAFGASIHFSSFRIKRNLSIESLEENSRVLLYFLDLAPEVLIAITLPIAIHLGNSEIRKYIKSLAN